MCKTRHTLNQHQLSNKNEKEQTRPRTGGSSSEQTLVKRRHVRAGFFPTIPQSNQRAAEKVTTKGVHYLLSFN